MKEQQKPIRVAIVDDHMIVREGLRLILETGEGFEIVGDAADGAAALELAARTDPDVMLLDLRMPEIDGLETLRRIHADWPAINVIILTTYNEDELMFRGLRAGARGYLLKDVGRETLLDAIRTAARGETLLQPEIMARLLVPNSSTAGRSGTSATEIHGTLTERELMILAAVARGERSKEIAAALKITERTVRGHLTNIYTKLGVDSRASAVAVALERAILPREPFFFTHDQPAK
ncbi:DNA-binding response regulator [Ktedonobacteria bacterium brp13]|nr:DNA-binding response regulator [Ktedonobacteria bacterium brp13]